MMCRMAAGEHKKIEITPNDLIIISANPIPGNEKSVSKVIDDLLQIGAEVVGNKIGNKVGNRKDKGLTNNRQLILQEIRNNPNITTVQLSKAINISETAIDNNLKYLKENGYLKRNGSNKTGYWEIIN